VKKVETVKVNSDGKKDSKPAMQAGIKVEDKKEQVKTVKSKLGFENKEEKPIKIKVKEGDGAVSISNKKSNKSKAKEGEFFIGDGGKVTVNGAEESVVLETLQSDGVEIST